MIATSFTKHNFYTQTGNFSFELDILVNNVTGICNFGFSGSASGNNFTFQCKSGKFIDNNNHYVDSYIEDVSNTVSGNISSNTVDYFINDDPVAFGLARPTGNLDYFYIQPQNCEVEFDVFINGDEPNYTVTSPYNFDSGITNIPVTITNNSLDFRIFTGFYQGNSNYANISGVPSIAPNGITGFYIRHSGLSGFVTFPFQLLTNFGLQNFTLNGYGG